MLLQPSIEIGRPQRFNRRFKFWSEQWPALLGTLAVSFLWISIAVTWAWFFAVVSPPEDYLWDLVSSLLIPVCGAGLYLVALMPVVFFLPAFFRNPTIESWNRERRQRYEKEDSPCFVVDLAFRPRVAGGLERIVEDADDVGLLSMRPDHLRFDGDSIQLILPWEDATDLKVKRTNWRGAWVMGKDFSLRFRSPIEGREGMVIRIREGRTILYTRERSRELGGLLEHHLQEAPRAPIA